MISIANKIITECSIDTLLYPYFAAAYQPNVLIASKSRYYSNYNGLRLELGDEYEPHSIV